MPRSARAESQERTRAGLLRTARAMFLADGYHATSLDRVAEAAGYSKGAVYSNFRNKDELCFAVLEQIYEGEIADIQQLFTSARTVEAGIAAFEQWAERMIGAEGRTVLAVEFTVAARRSPQLRARLAALDRRMAGVIAQLIADRAAALGVNPLLPAEVLAPALLHLGMGIALQRVADPGQPVRVLIDTMRVLLGLRPPTG